MAAVLACLGTPTRIQTEPATGTTGTSAGTLKTDGLPVSPRDLRKLMFVHRRTAMTFAIEANRATRRADDATAEAVRRFHLESAERARRALAVERAHHSRIAVQLAALTRPALMAAE